jgi:hypothetical protein
VNEGVPKSGLKTYKKGADEDKLGRRVMRVD